MNTNLASEESEFLSATKTLQTRHVFHYSLSPHDYMLASSEFSNNTVFITTETVPLYAMSHHGGRSFHGHKKQEKETPEADNAGSKEDDEEEEDPFDTRIKKSGCADLHYALLVSSASTDIYKYMISQFQDSGGMLADVSIL